MQFDPSRRLFLRRAGIAAVAPIVAPVLPVEKVVKYFFAPAGGWETTQYLDTQWISTKALELLNERIRLRDFLSFGGDFDNLFKVTSAVTIRFPQRFHCGGFKYASLRNRGTESVIDH